MMPDADAIIKRIKQDRVVTDPKLIYQEFSSIFPVSLQIKS